MTMHEKPVRGDDPALTREGPHDRLMAAIGILQAHYLANDSALDAQQIFGVFYLKDSGIEHAINMLIELLPVVEDAERRKAA